MSIPSKEIHEYSFHNFFIKFMLNSFHHSSKIIIKFTCLRSSTAKLITFLNLFPLCWWKKKKKTDSQVDLCTLHSASIYGMIWRHWSFSAPMNDTIKNRIGIFFIGKEFSSTKSWNYTAELWDSHPFLPSRLPFRLSPAGKQQKQQMEDLILFLIRML